MKAAGNDKQAINKRELVWKSVIFVFVMVYQGMFAYLNLAKYSQHVDADIAAEVLLAREICGVYQRQKLYENAVMGEGKYETANWQ